ncbi:MAG: alpha/beta hydrolase-fold protein [Saprospiraceae bacterium]
MKNKFPFFLLLLFPLMLTSQSTHKLEVEVSIDPSLKEQFQPAGRLLLFLSKDGRGELRFRTWPRVGNFIFAKNISNWPLKQPMTINKNAAFMQTSAIDLDAMSQDTFYLQVVWDQDREESRPEAPGNLYSEVQKVIINKDQKVSLKIDKVIAPRRMPNHPHIKEVTFKSDTLSKWWGKDMYLKVGVLLPGSYFEKGDAKFAFRYNIAGYGGRYTRASRLVNNKEFMGWWLSPEAPQIVTIYLDGEGPFGDSYQLDSENNGPYGYALTEELIPHLEKEFRGTGRADSRFLDGCSTGGWVSLALQIYYPDLFNGTWSYSPDAIDFENYQLVNVYKDANLFYNEWNNLRPLARDLTGDPSITVKDFIQYENVLGYSDTYATSGGQFSAHNALYSPKGPDGLPAPLFDPQTGVIDPAIAEYWKKYDLKLQVKENWSELGPKLQGKIWIWMGDMDNFYLNPATRAFDEFLKTTTNPVSDAHIEFTPMAGHCAQYDQKAVLKMMGDRLAN